VNKYCKGMVKKNSRNWKDFET